MPYNQDWKLMRMAIAVLVVLSFSSIIQSAMIFDVYVDQISRFALVLTSLIGILFTALNFLSGSSKYALFTLLMSAIILMYGIIFSLNFGLGFNQNSLLPYLSILNFSTFFYFRRDFQKVWMVLLVCSLIYLATYVFLANHVLALSTSSVGIGVLGGTDGRSDRVFLSPTFLVFAIGALIVFFQQKKLWIFAVSFFLCVYCLVIFQSRAITFFIIVSLMMSLFVHGRNWPQYLVAGVTLFIGWLQYLAVLFNFDFHNLIADDSYRIRAYSLDIAKYLVSEYPIFGTGIPTDHNLLNEQLQSVFPYFAADLGFAGIAAQFGFLGVLLFSITTLVMFLPPRDIPHHTSVAFVGATLGMYGLIAPSIWLGSGVIALALFIAMQLSSRVKL